LDNSVCGQSPIADSSCPVLQLLAESKIVLPRQGDAVVGLEITEALFNGIVDFLNDELN
jgi:hypothetical protein